MALYNSKMQQTLLQTGTPMLVADDVQRAPVRVLFDSGSQRSYITKSSRIPKNLLSAYEHRDVVQNKLNKELQENRLAGPFRSPPFAKFHVSPIGVVPKNAPGDFRLIHHLSYPSRNSVNDFIDKSERTVSYAMIDDAIRIIKRLGKGCAMSKTDIKSAFRIIPVHPLDYRILGMHWEGNYYYDKALPMGCSSSCKIFETFSTSGMDSQK